MVCEIEQFTKGFTDLDGFRLIKWASGALAKGVATAATYPYIRSKIVLQSSAGKKCEYLKAKQRSRKSSVDLAATGISATKTIASEEADFSPRLIVAREKSGPELTTVASFCALESGENKYNFPPHGVRGSRPPETKAYRQSYSDSSDDETSYHDQQSVVGVMISTLITHGIGGLYEGLGLQLLKTTLTAAFLYMWKENTDHTLLHMAESCRRNRRARNRRMSQ